MYWCIHLDLKAITFLRKLRPLSYYAFLCIYLQSHLNYFTLSPHCMQQLIHTFAMSILLVWILQNVASFHCFKILFGLLDLVAQSILYSLANPKHIYLQWMFTKALSNLSFIWATIILFFILVSKWGRRNFSTQLSCKSLIIWLGKFYSWEGNQCLLVLKVH